MNIRYHKNFLKQLAKVPSDTRIKIEQFVFEDLPKLSSITKSGKIEKMKSYNVYYKVRFGSYRVGIKLDGEILILQTVMDRKEIYRFFP